MIFIDYSKPTVSKQTKTQKGTEKVNGNLKNSSLAAYCKSA
jgi:hypothetical protein